jgi:hypothetical protein
VGWLGMQDLHAAGMLLGRVRSSVKNDLIPHAVQLVVDLRTCAQVRQEQVRDEVRDTVAQAAALASPTNGVRNSEG